MNTRFAIITPAYNEEQFLERTIAAVVAQTVRPAKWIIVNDNSTDRTASIAESWAARHDFIECLTITREAGRNFGQKARAFNQAVAKLDLGEYDYIGNLDADILLEPAYFENILARFVADPTLGITGGIVFTTVSTGFVTFDKNPNSVGGAVQLFRMRCFEEIGSRYIPLPFGGIDAAAEATAKQKGWRVEKSLANKVYEQRATGSVGHTPVRAGLRLGRRFHSLGYGCFYYAFRCVYRIRDKPMVLGSLFAFAGYMGSLFRREPVLLSEDVVSYMRKQHRAHMVHSLMPWLRREKPTGGRP